MEKRLQAFSKAVARSQPCTKVQSLFGKQSIAASEKDIGRAINRGMAMMHGKVNHNLEQ